MLWTAERAWNHRPGDFVFPGDFVVVLLLNLCYNKLRSTRWCGEIGRRKGLKIPRWQHRTGSSPVTSTMTNDLRVVIRIKTGWLSSACLYLCSFFPGAWYNWCIIGIRCPGLFQRLRMISSTLQPEKQACGSRRPFILHLMR